jgi:hypothetical protein
VKTSVQPTLSIVGRNGGKLLSGGVPGHRGGGGRPPNWFIDFAVEQLDDPTTREQVTSVLHDKDHQHFARIYRTLLERIPTGGEIDAAAVRAKLDRTITLISELLTPADAQSVLIALRRVWAA